MQNLRHQPDPAPAGHNVCLKLIRWGNYKPNMKSHMKSGLGCRITWIAIALVITLHFTLPGPARAQRKKRDVAPAPPDAQITSEEAANLEAVITTELGAIRFEFYPDKAPKHVSQFITLARSGFYDGSSFFRLFKGAFIQGGDPQLKDPSTPREKWGTGGLKQLPDELSDLKQIRGTVSSVRISTPGNGDTAQFFICSSPQPQLEGQYSIFGRVTEGIQLVDKISTVPVDNLQLAATPIKIISIKIEPKKVEPFKNADIEQMRKEVLLITNFGDITLEMDPGTAPEHVRNFLKLVQSGWYDHTIFHRLARGFVLQGGFGYTRTTGPQHPTDRWVHSLKPEFSNINHIRGVLSMARTDDPNSADTSFFIVLGTSPHLDGKYSVFGKVVAGFDTLEKIEKVPVDGETPRVKIELIEAMIKP